jgi:regulator of RNase E activity RraA
MTTRLVRWDNEFLIPKQDQHGHQLAVVVARPSLSKEMRCSEMSMDGQELSWIEYLKMVDAPTLSNAIEILKVRPRREGFTPLQVRALFPDFGRMCGYAVTAQAETITESEDQNISGFIELFRAVEQSKKPAVIALQEIGGYPDYAVHCGEVMATIFKRLGAVGLVSDCAVRDVPEVRALGFHYFARGAVVSRASLRIVRVGVAVQVCGLVIRPGDLLHGDANGLLLVPNGVEESLPRAVDAVRSQERRLMEWVRGEGFSLDCLGDRMVE